MLGGAHRLKMEVLLGVQVTRVRDKKRNGVRVQVCHVIVSGTSGGDITRRQRTKSSLRASALSQRRCESCRPCFSLASWHNRRAIFFFLFARELVGATTNIDTEGYVKHDFIGDLRSPMQGDRWSAVLGRTQMC